VRTTVRNLSQEEEVRKLIKDAGVEATDRLPFFATDLMEDDGWAAAVKGCAYVQHVASPFPGKDAER
jgi:dihydroflavonol-4-reductase